MPLAGGEGSQIILPKNEYLSAGGIQNSIEIRSSESESSSVHQFLAGQNTLYAAGTLLKVSVLLIMIRKY